MWLENSPVSNPLSGLRCINWYAGCDMATSLILPQVTGCERLLRCDGDLRWTKWMHGMMSDAFYQYLQQMPVGGSMSMTINAYARLPSPDDASKAERAADQASGARYVRKVTHTKAANFKAD